MENEESEVTKMNVFTRKITENYENLFILKREKFQNHTLETES